MKRKTFSLAIVAVMALFCGAALAAGVQPTEFLSHDALAALGALGGMPFMVGDTDASMTIAEQRTQFDTKRKTAVARMKELMDLCSKEGRTLDEKEAEEYDGLEADIATIDKHLKRLDSHEKTMLANGGGTQAVNQSTGREEQTQFRGTSVDVSGNVISVRRNIAKGIPFARYAIAVALGKGNLMQSEIIAQNRFKDTPEVALALKTAVAAGTTQNTTWAAPLVQYQDMANEFIDYLRPMTILGRLQLQPVPFNVRLPRQTAGVSGGFVGEGSAIPVQKPQFDNITHPWAKVACITVITGELARLGNPSSEMLVRNDLAKGMAAYLDRRLVDPAYPGVANTSPASLTNGVTPTQASGATLAALDKDVRAVMTAFATAELGLQQGVWLMSASSAIRLSMMRTNQDSKAFPDLTVNGGIFYGLPALVSNSVAGSGSPGDQFLILVNQEEVMLSDDGDVEIDASQEASLEMNDAPAGGATSLQSLWQQGLIGLRAMRYIYWTKRRSEAVQFIDKAQSYSS